MLLTLCPVCVQMDYASAMSALERARIMLDAKDRHSDDVSRDLELAGLEKEQILGDQAGVAMATQVCAAPAAYSRRALSWCSIQLSSTVAWCSMLCVFGWCQLCRAVDKGLARCVVLFNLQALCREVRMQQEQLARAKHDKLLALRAYKAAEDALREAQEELPPLKIAR